jgi:glycosyltransferase involved in cell wall biosynthesis
MACIVKVPTPEAPGVLVFTTQERDNAILGDGALAARVAALKPRWLIGLHHNWHDHAFIRNELFDFSMAGEDDLRGSSGDAFPLVPLDACNFVPAFFNASTTADKFWDLLYIARPVFFKGFPMFLDTVRALYDGGQELRVLCVAPMPPYRRRDRRTVIYDVAARYQRMFTAEERHRFTLLTIETDYPFPLDVETLAHLYRSSRVFAHFAPDERRCRVAAYAWATGMPVVGTAAVGSLLPVSVRRTPFFREAADPPSFAREILAALADARSQPDFAPVHAVVCEDQTRTSLKQSLERLSGDRFGAAPAESYALQRLDLRLGRHHGLSSGGNRVASSVAHLVSLLAGDEDRVRGAVGSTEDPEVELALESPETGA